MKVGVGVVLGHVSKQKLHALIIRINFVQHLFGKLRKFAPKSCLLFETFEKCVIFLVALFVDFERTFCGYS